MDLSQVILARKPVNSSFIQEVILIFLCCHFGLSCGLDYWCSLYLQCLHFYYLMTNKCQLTILSDKVQKCSFWSWKERRSTESGSEVTRETDDVSEWETARKWLMYKCNWHIKGH